MIVKIPKLSGFCPGVKNAENRIFDELESNPAEDHSVLGMMINNRKYIEYLYKNKIKTIDKIENISRGATVFIRTHGIDKNLQNRLSDKFKLIDLTCRNVKRVQMIIQEKAKKGAVIFITGKKSHPEVIGLMSYGENSIVFENQEDLEAFLNEPMLNGASFNSGGFTELFITSQTTGDRALFEETIESIKAKWPEAEINQFNSICPVTEKKETEALAIQKEVDISFVLGDPVSSNASRLFKILKNADPNTWFIQDADELNNLKIDLNSFGSALVVSSASTPGFVEAEVVEFLKHI